MNQILSMNGGMDTPGGGNSNNYYNNNRQSQPLETGTTVRIFAIVLIVFGLLMAIAGIVNIATVDRNQNVEEWPKFESEQLENNLIVIISHDKVIDKVVYRWNSETEKEIPGTGERNMQVNLNVPVGENILILKSIDVDGKETIYQKSFTGIEVGDPTLPEIELTLIGTKLNIVARTTTQTPLAYLTYQWNSEQETKIEASTDYDKAMLQTQTAIPKGKNTIKITAVKENGVSDTVTRKFIGALKPTITVNQQEGRLNITISHESGIESAKVVFNDRNIALSSDRFGQDKQTVNFSVALKEGQENTIYIEATSCDGSTETYNGIAQV